METRSSKRRRIENPPIELNDAQNHLTSLDKMKDNRPTDKNCGLDDHSEMDPTTPPDMSELVRGNKMDSNDKKAVEVGACLLEGKLPQTTMVNISIETELNSAPSNYQLRQTSVRRKRKKRKTKRDYMAAENKDKDNKLPETCSLIKTGSTSGDLSMEKPVNICSNFESETSEVADETKCCRSSVDINTATELKPFPSDCDKHLPRKDMEKRKRKRKRKRKLKTDATKNSGSSDVRACLVEKHPCHASEVAETELKSTPPGSELSSPMKTRKKKKRNRNAAATNDDDTQKANDNDKNFSEFSSFVETTSTEAELLANICSMNTVSSKLDDSETETSRKSSEKEIPKSVQEVAESFMENIKECKDDKNEVGTLMVTVKPKSIRGREKRKTKSERKCLRGGLVGDSVIEVAFRSSTNDLGSVYMTEQSKEMYKVKNSNVTTCENDSIKDVVTKTMMEAVPPMFLSSLDSKKKLLVLDVNGLLADIVPCSRFIKGDTIISRKAVFKRPYCDDFLQFCFQNFNVGVWSSRTKENLGKAINFLIGDSKHKLLFCWDQSHCTATGFNTLGSRDKPLLLKELRKLWENDTLPWGNGEYDKSNTLLLDDSPYKALRNPAHTAIFPYPYQFRNAKTDSSLGPDGDLRMYLKTIATAENVQKHVEQNHFGQARITETDPSWHFYSKIISFDS